MRAASLRHFLQSLCSKPPWNYAVFWKLQHEYATILTWEDGYLDIPCAREPYRSLIGNYYSKTLNELFPNCGSRSHNGNLGEHPIGLAMAEMSSTYHVAGKGVVGEVASLCIPHWISSDSIAPAELSFGSVAECPDEWLLQFAAGIKTILLVPCIPHGVLQLGSMETVAENVEMVTNLAEELDAHFKFVENFLPGGGNCEFLLQSTLSESLDILSATTTIKVNEDDLAADIAILKDHKLSTAFLMTSSIEVQHPFQLSGQNMRNTLEDANESKIGKFDENVPNVLENANESKIEMQHADMINQVKQLNHEYSDDNKSGITENSLDRSSCHAKDVDTFSYSSCNVVGGVNASNELDFYFDGDVLDTQSLGMDCSDTIVGNPTECELYKALGSTIHNNLSGFSENTASKSMYTADPMFNIELSFGESNGWPLKEDNAENLLEAVVASSLNKMTSLESLNMPLEKPVPFCKRKNQSTESALVGDNTVTWRTLTSASAGADRYALTNCSPSASSFGCVVNAFNEGQHQTKAFSSLSCRKESKISNTNKKRERSGDSHRPRPRDRQLIQDRLKELRQLVPNGAKCSIDGLLHKTIKHMLFLRSVADQADKLRCQAQKEVAPDKSLQSPELKTSDQRGTSWALELGSEDQICPIIVKDLEYPGHMLIEMMCDDHGRFLEIADVIHRLELRILKGVMEKRQESTWAHFIVEASGSCHRLDIFWPLMQLLQQVPSSISCNM
ncbi:PREDICTED: transcription factor EMB1444-like [Nicotiana attenuata]|uniref:Transcription factor emb1444 n=1 Tax=Nicotiana attenuata TaxID=49451 RepID=A0A1J6I9L6_NICAT|nr:PREDICTED: transcription factor EMB1444-like [Nicotiana attenuata]OIT01132.1 transcription factor emb1444 [Nicotiana attenuata]